MLPFMGTALGAPAAGQAISGIGSFLASAIPSIFSSLIGGQKDRISNRDFQFYQDLADSGNPREIARQNEFLKGVTPTNAAAYNQYQDMTQPQDTQRQIDRIMATAKGTGMSPWELNGGSAATPLPSAPLGPTEGTNQGAQFLSQLTPLITAQMNNATALQTTAMNNDTAKSVTEMQTGTQVKTTGMQNETAKWVANFAQTGPKAKVEMLNTAADTILKTAQSANVLADTKLKGALTGQAHAQTDFLKGSTANLPSVRALNESSTALNLTNITVQQRKSILDAAVALLQFLPEDKWTTGAYTRTETPGANNIIPILRELANNSRSGDRITGLTDLQLDEATKWAIGMADTIQKGMGMAGKVKELLPAKPGNRIGF